MDAVDTGIRFSFLAATGLAREVIADPAVGAAWDLPSALRRYTVAGLAGHLARGVLTVVDYLDTPEPEGTPLAGPAAYFAAVLTDDDIDSEAQVAVRRRGEELGGLGQATLVRRLDEAQTWLQENLPLAPPDRRMRVLGDRVILVDDYLATRVVELALHSDDVCVSVSKPTPDIPGIDLAIRTLVDVARVRHGDLAVLRALARRERDPGEILRVM
jgi:hypothetical protein